MTTSQRENCHFIIHGAATAAAGIRADFAQLPRSDSVVQLPIQIAMVVALRPVFDIDLTESAAKGPCSPASPLPSDARYPRCYSVGSRSSAMPSTPPPPPVSRKRWDGRPQRDSIRAKSAASSRAQKSTGISSPARPFASIFARPRANAKGISRPAPMA